MAPSWPSGQSIVDTDFIDLDFIDLDILLTRIRQAQSKVYFLDAVEPTAEKVGASFMDARRGLV